NRLSTEKRAQVAGCLVEGMSIRATVRTTGVAKNTIVKLLADLGSACSAYADMALRDLDIQRIEADEIWSFCYAKQKNVPEEFRGTEGYGDVWTWVAIDADTKLVPSWLVGERTTEDCFQFLHDLRTRMPQGHRFQLFTDGYRCYRSAVDILWAPDEIDYALVIKDYDSNEGPGTHRYSPATCKSVEKKVVHGDPDAAKISTSFVERQNLTMRMGMRRFTRLTNAFSKKIENHAHAISLHFFHYNFCRAHQTLSGKGRGQGTPAMAAGVETAPWTITQLCELLESN
ncbi:MAG: transposase, partial [Actinomycetia bacterium]|nr:transposase [Actinomycetes bacterium]